MLNTQHTRDICDLVRCSGGVLGRLEHKKINKRGTFIYETCNIYLHSVEIAFLPNAKINSRAKLVVGTFNQIYTRCVVAVDLPRQLADRMNEWMNERKINE